MDARETREQVTLFAGALGLVGGERKKESKC